MGKFKLIDKKIGRTELMMSSISLGCVTFGREIDEETSWKILDYAMENGIKLYDTAELYGGGNAKENRKKWFGIDDTREVTTEMYSSEKILYISKWIKNYVDNMPIKAHSLVVGISGGIDSKPQQFIKITPFSFAFIEKSFSTK